MLLGMKLLGKLSMHMNKKIQINFFCKSNHWSRRMKKIREIAKKVIKKVLERHELRRSTNNQIGESV